MYKIEKISKIENSNSHLNFSEPNIHEYKTMEYNPEEFWKNNLPDGIQNMPTKNKKELMKKGKTLFTFTKTITLNVEMVGL